MKSKFLKLNINDVLKGGIVTVIAAILTVVLEVLQAGSLDFDYRKIIIVGLTAGISYLLKNLGSDEESKFVGKV